MATGKKDGDREAELKAAIEKIRGRDLEAWSGRCRSSAGQEPETRMTTVFILVFSITSGGSTIELRSGQTYATEQDCMADREKLIDAHRKAYPQGPGESITAHYKQVQR